MFLESIALTLKIILCQTFVTETKRDFCHQLNSARGLGKKLINDCMEGLLASVKTEPVT